MNLYKGNPPKADDKWEEGDKMMLNVQLSVSYCIKLFVRPPRVKGRPDEMAGKVEWQKSVTN